MQTQGRAFEVDNRPFRFSGANVAVMHGRPHREAVLEVLDRVVADGGKVVRVWAFGEYPADAPAWTRDYAFRIGNEFVESSFEHLDRVLVHAKRLNLRVILVLSNRWADYGGIPQIMRACGESFASREASDREIARFFNSPRCEEHYRAHVRRIVERQNSLSGELYRNDPTIFSYELANELSVHFTDRQSLVDWTSRQSSSIRSLDPQHLIGAGHIGYLTASNFLTWRTIQELPAIGYADQHAYPSLSTGIANERDMELYVATRVPTVEKPFVWGEFGFDQQTFVPSQNEILQRAFFQNSFASEAAGALAWVYLPTGDSRQRYANSSSALVRQASEVFAQPQSLAIRASNYDFVGSPFRRVLLQNRITPSRLRSRSIALDVLTPSQIEAERGGVYGARSEDLDPHTWTEGSAAVSFRFRRAMSPRNSIRISFLASSELPGPGSDRRESDVQRIRVTLDGEDLGVVSLPPDNGHAQAVEVDFALSQEARRRIARTRIHRLTFETTTESEPFGFCLFADPSLPERLSHHSLRLSF